MMIRGLRRGQPRTDGRGKLRTKVVAGVVAITLAVLAVFDFAAVTALKKYLVGQTDVSLKSALTVTKPRLDQLLPAFSKARVVGAGVQFSSVPIVGAYNIEWVPAKGEVVNLQGGPGLTRQAMIKYDFAVANAAASVTVRGKPMPGKGQAQQVIATINQLPQFRVVSMAVPGQAGTLVAGTNLSDVNDTGQAARDHRRRRLGGRRRAHLPRRRPGHAAGPAPHRADGAPGRPHLGRRPY